MTSASDLPPPDTDINIVGSAGPTDEVVMDSSAPSLEPDQQKREGVAPEIWVVGLIAVIIILLLLFGVAL